MRLTKKLKPPYEQILGQDYVYTSDLRLTPSFASVEQKLGQLEDVEEELGIDLITLFKALLNGIYYKGAYGTNDYGKIVYKEHPTIIFENTSKLYCFKPTFFDFINLIDYGKTWALTKKELL